MIGRLFAAFGRFFASFGRLIARVWHAALAAAPLKVWAMIFGLPVLTAAGAALTLIVWKGPWPLGQAGKQLDILGAALLFVIALVGVGYVSLASVKFSGRGPGGLGFEIDGDGPDPQPPAATVTTTTETTIEAPAPAEPARRGPRERRSQSPE